MEKMNRQDSKWESQLKKGLLDYFVLLVLADKPAHGYGIAAALRAIDAFEVGEGTLYPLLARLAKRDLVKAAWVTEGAGPAKKVYTITRKGRKEIATMDESLAATIIHSRHARRGRWPVHSTKNFLVQNQKGCGRTI